MFFSLFFLLKKSLRSVFSHFLVIYFFERLCECHVFICFGTYDSNYRYRHRYKLYSKNGTNPPFIQLMQTMTLNTILALDAHVAKVNISRGVYWLHLHHHHRPVFNHWSPQRSDPRSPLLLRVDSGGGGALAAVT